MRYTILFTLILALAFSCGQKEEEKPVETKAPEQEQPFETITRAEIDSILQRVENTPMEPVGENEVAVLETNYGTMVMDFFPEKAPKHCASFKRLAKAGYYDGTRFHRILKDFVIQGGDILTRDDNPQNDGTGGPGYTLEAEFNDIPHDFGIVSMARSQDPNSAGSQFFICLSRERTKALDGKYTVFGQIIEGEDVVRKIANVQVKANSRGEPSVPVEHVILKRVYMKQRDRS